MIKLNIEKKNLQLHFSKLKTRVAHYKTDPREQNILHAVCSAYYLMCSRLKVVWKTASIFLFCFFQCSDVSFTCSSRLFSLLLCSAFLGTFSFLLNLCLPLTPSASPPHLPPTGTVDQRVLGDKYPGPRAHQPPIPATLLCHIVAEASLKRH